VRFDDTLGTVLAARLDTPAARAAAWRQIVDLVGRGRVAPDPAALDLLEAHRSSVALDVRASSARALFGARPPLELVRLLIADEIAVAAPILRSAALDAEAWIALLPSLSPQGRAILRHRRDLPDAVARALEAFGGVDFVLADQADREAVAPTAIATPPASVPEVVETPASFPVTPAEPEPFLSVGAIARGLPLVAEAFRRGNDNEPQRTGDGTFRIADVVARIEAFRRRREEGETHDSPDAAPACIREGFRFDTDVTGSLRATDADERGALLGISIARAAQPGGAGVDGVAAGAFRRRAPFRDARLVVAGEGEAAGLWLVTATPGFDPASGRFTGYRGSARRPRPHEQVVDSSAGAARAADSLRQLVHELRTPTNAIAGFSEMIEHEMLGPVDEAYRMQARAIRRDAAGLLATIDDLDTAARIEAGALELRPEAVTLGDIFGRVERQLADLADEREARLANSGGDVRVSADVRQLERLLLRLCATMLAAAGEGEAIALDAGPPSGRTVTLTLTRAAAFATYPREAILSVDDEVSPASLLGAGFALRLARGVARQLGGTLDFGATTLTLRLPAASRAVGQGEAQAQ
jgi:signal transduction histidine kinase